jgi:sulfate permease, SulP family
MLKRLFPFLEWFQGYKGRDLGRDVMAGGTVALVLIPQSLAYAKLAGLPLQYGLYASLLPPIVGALFGSSRQLCTGPVAIASLLTAVALEPVAVSGSAGYAAYAVLLAFMVGLFQFCLGLFRLGIVIHLLSLPVIHGFITAAALIIASSQLGGLLGVAADKGEHQYETVIRVLEAAGQYVHWPSLLMAAFAFAIIFGCRRFHPTFPGALVAVVLTTILSWGLGFGLEAEADISALKSSHANKLVAEFNQALDAVPPLVERRNQANKELTSARKSLQMGKTVDLRHEIDSLALRIAQHRGKAAQLRREIRRLVFEAAPSGDGMRVFYPRGVVPEGVEGDGRGWRIRVEGEPFATDRIKLRGGGDVVGAIPGGLPGFALPVFDVSIVLQLLSYMVVIALLGFMEAATVSKSIAAKTGQRLDYNQELIGQGLAKLSGAFWQSYLTSGSFSRSAINFQAGGVTGLSGVFTGLVVAVALSFFTSLLYYLPQATLSAVIMVAVIRMVSFSGLIRAWKTQRFDGAIGLITFASTLYFAPRLDKGIFIGVGLSLLFYLYKGMRPKVSSLSPGKDGTLHDASGHGLKPCPYIELIRFSGPLFFPNASYLEETISEHRKVRKDLRHILIVANGINDIDTTGADALSLIVDRVRSGGVDISLCGLTTPVRQALKQTGLLTRIGQDHIFPNIDQALCAIYEQAHGEDKEENCPLAPFCGVKEREE